ncbi:hypothetical protein Taro_007260 [Colocasia esculenta]|uniref:Retrotransposon gag domain-containing protein n=1 Tax=Colocasia esculenta TaxID=4460 RepID=A0A843TTL5_COLES|nr:hypothetical protein [Colocasia esculenta]
MADPSSLPRVAGRGEEAKEEEISWGERCGRLSLNLTASGPDVNPLAVQIGGEVCGRLFVASVEIGQPESSNLSSSFPLIPSTFAFVCFHHFQWLMGARGKTLVRVAVLDRAGNMKIWCDSRGDFEGFQRDCTMAPRRRPRREWLSRRLVRRLETPRHLSRRSLCHRTHTVHRDAPVPQGGTGKVLREFLQFRPPQFLGQPDPDIARAWLDAVERTFRSMECVPEERVLLASYQLQAQALTWWSSEWETTFQSRPLRQIPWQEFVVSFERAFCPTYVRTERLHQFLDLQQMDSTVVQYMARFVELGRYAPQIMADESLRTQQFVRVLRPELRQALIVARITDLDAAYQTAAALEADTLRTRAPSAEVQTQSSVQATPKATTSYASTSARTTAKSGSRRKFRRDRRQAE